MSEIMRMPPPPSNREGNPTKTAKWRLFYCLKDTHAALLVGLGRAAALRTPPLRLLASLHSRLYFLCEPLPGCYLI